MIVKVDNLEIRGCERKVSLRTNRDYLIVRVDDSTGKQNELLDWNLENENAYIRGKNADFWLNLELGKYTNVSINHFRING